MGADLREMISMWLQKMKWRVLLLDWSKRVQIYLWSIEDIAFSHQGIVLVILHSSRTDIQRLLWSFFLTFVYTAVAGNS